MSHSIAIVGSGPGGFYCAEAISKNAKGAKIDMIERLPTPFGLVRSGVAPDHQGIKNVVRVFDRIAKLPNVRFVGNVEVGRDVSMKELCARYDAVVIASGANIDRRLHIEGEELDGVYGSGEITAWYNGHPDFAETSPSLRGPGLAIIGNGNVALDISRILCRSAEEMRESDIPDYALRKVLESGVKDIYLLGRRGPMNAKFTPVELREMGELSRAQALIEHAQLPAAVDEPDSKRRKVKEKLLSTLQGFSGDAAENKEIRVHFNFFSSPKRILGDGRVRGLEVARTRLEGDVLEKTGEVYTLDVSTIISCVGYRPAPISGADFALNATHFENIEGKIQEGVYVVGWAKRGPSGTVATNRKDSIGVAKALIAELKGPGKDGPSALDGLLRERGVQTVSYEEWQHIDQVEQGDAAPGAPRRKLTTRQGLLGALDGASS